MKAPSRFWYVAKNGTPVRKYDTSGETYINSPETCESVAVETREELSKVDLDPSVLTVDEKEILGIVE